MSFYPGETGRAIAPYAPIVRGSINTRQSHTGDLIQTQLGPLITVPANAMGPNGELRVDFLFSNNNSGNNKTFWIFIGTVDPGLSTLFSFTNTTNIALKGRSHLFNRNDAASQIQMNSGTSVFYGATSAALQTRTIDTTLPLLVKVMGQLANAGDTLALEALSVTTIYRD